MQKAYFVCSRAMYNCGLLTDKKIHREALLLKTFALFEAFRGSR